MWLPIHINEQSAEPLYYQIEVQLRALIVSGQLEEGALLPSIRELAQLLKCSVITVRRVYQDLENEGLLRTKQGTGTYVARIEQNAMDRFRLDAVTEALEAAVEAGKLVQCTREELTKLFQEVLDRKLEGER
ncbi:GntR family transcriptional regulator [Paenibacillus sp. BK033]|uniref:GntR family transcriptional regulator n=1 Tax=unclassified Paenibacillus TaxID=185978 RepID=UPI001052D271|nr:GntR family transcriptional regulator [Paenibacillus sp. BK033]NIK70779.1 GntR family transcriptional regulator [Paenibacillus sp. BK720]TCM93249.1 GntR family transcriptional regulator [Paenibacillus sp. BK033]